MTSSDIRKSFLDFFKSKQHTIVPSSSLMPDSPNLLFTNAGMNQFVPIFLGQTKCPYNPPRAADTQKCIRAGGKHNDLDDVGLDTYHHTFFEMLGNWSFGDYFKKEAIDWAWELITEVWKFPRNRLYATVYSPDKAKGDPSDFDQEAYDFWAAKFSAAGLDPKVHIVYGNKKDNFWMMGETGPCGPCSELHVDLTPNGDTKGSLVNKGDARCIEIWNLVFIQFNANPDGTFSPLPAKHVDTGMGFERATSIIQCTKNFTDFSGIISNYETDVFRPIFDVLEKLSRKKYTSTLPPADLSAINPQQSTDVAFRVIADHIRTLSFAIADGIQPGNNDRNYVLRRILRRAVRYGRTLGFHEPFLFKLVDVLVAMISDAFPELRIWERSIENTIRSEEEAFNKTLDSGSEIFESAIDGLTTIKNFLHECPRLFDNAREQIQELKNWPVPTEQEKGVWAANILDAIRSPEFVQQASELSPDSLGKTLIAKQIIMEWQNRWKALWEPVRKDLFEIEKLVENPKAFSDRQQKILNAIAQLKAELPAIESELKIYPGRITFKLYDTYGFPYDLTELMARERGLTVDKAGFDRLMEEQKTRARAAQKKEVISLSEIQTNTPTKFVGFEQNFTDAKILEIVGIKNKIAVILDVSPFYAEMGGQVGDTGVLIHPTTRIGTNVVNTIKSGSTWLHLVDADAEVDEFLPEVGATVRATVDWNRRPAIERHHTVTHLLHWALHEVVSKEASQKGSFVGPDKLTFDFNHAPLTPQQIADIEKLVNERILENAGVSWTEVPYADVKSRKDVMQFFGDKYGDTVRVVQIGGQAHALDGYSMELCGGTHTRATGEIGLFRIVSEAATGAGIRRIEAVAGLEAYRKAAEDVALIKSLAGKVNSPLHELDKKIDALLAHQKELEKSLKASIQRNAAQTASWLLTRAQDVNGIPLITQIFPDGDADYLQAVADALKGKFKGVVVVGGGGNGSVTLIASVSPEFTAKVQAGKIIQQIAPIVGGKGGGKPDNARGGGKDVAKLDEALAKVKTLLQ